MKKILAVACVAAVFSTSAASLQAAETAMCNLAYRTVVYEVQTPEKDVQQRVGSLGVAAASKVGVSAETLLDSVIGAGKYEIRFANVIEINPDGKPYPHADTKSVAKLVTQENAGATTSRSVNHVSGLKISYTATSTGSDILTEVKTEMYDSTPVGTAPESRTMAGVMRPGGFLGSQWGSHARYGALTQLVSTNCK